MPIIRWARSWTSRPARTRSRAPRPGRNRNRNALRSALTGSKIDLIDLRSEPLELRAGDWVVLASDGLGSLSGDEIADVIYRFRQSTPEEMADGLIAAVTQRAPSTRTTPPSWAVRVEKDAKSASDDVTTRVMRSRRKGEDVELAYPPHRQDGAQDLDPGTASGTAGANGHMVGGGCGLLPILCRGDAVAIAAVNDRCHPQATTSAPPPPAAVAAPGPAAPDAPDTTGPDAARQRIPAGPGPTTPDTPQAVPDNPDAARAAESNPAGTSKERSNCACKSGPASRTASNAPCRLHRRLLRIRKRSPAAPAAAPGTQHPVWRSAGAPRTDKATRQGKEGEKPLRKSRGGEGGIEGRAQESAQQGPPQGCPPVGLQQ